MPTCLETVDVVCMTRPDVFVYPEHPKQALPYERVVGALVPDVGDEPAMIYGETASGERQVELPADMARRLLEAIGLINQYRGLGLVNCHYFSRIVTGTTAASVTESFQPVVRQVRGLSSVSSLELGRIGLIGLGHNEVEHSLVGLGTDSPDSLQSLSGGEELAFADTGSVIDYYQRIYPDQPVGLFAA